MPKISFVLSLLGAKGIFLLVCFGASAVGVKATSSDAFCFLCHILWYIISKCGDFLQNKKFSHFFAFSSLFLIHVCIGILGSSGFAYLAKSVRDINSLLFIVKYFVFSDKYFNNNGDLCDVLTYLEKFEKDLYMAPVYDLYVAANRDWNELVSQKATDASINTIINFLNLSYLSCEIKPIL